MTYILRVLFLSILSFKTFAAPDVNQAQIIKLMLDRGHDGERVYIKLDKRQSKSVSCHSNVSWEYVLDISDSFGKSIYSALLTSYASGKKIDYSGYGNCNLFRSIETLRRIELN